MRDRFEKLLQGKLRDHASVPSGKVWERIERDLPAGDTLETQLQSKLRNHADAPPAGMWERIERDLPAAQPASAAPRSRIFPIVVRYAAAASLLAAAIVTASIYLRPDAQQPPVALAPEATTDSTPALKNAPGTIATLGTRESASEIPASPTLPVRYAASKAVKPAIATPAEAIALHAAPGTLLSDAIPAAESTQPGGASAPGKTASGSPETSTQPDSQNTQTTQPAEAPRRTSNQPGYARERFAASNATRYNPIRKMGSPSPTQRRLSMSLYAANLGRGSSNGETGTRASWDGYKLTEVVSRAMDNNQHTYYSTPTVTKAEHHVPLSFGLGVAFDLAPRLSLESGLTYSYLRSDYHAEGSASVSNYDIRQELHYLGIPVALLYRFAKTAPVNFYLRGGGMLEKGVDGERRTQLASSKKTTETTGIRMRGVQSSVSASLGFQVDITPSLGIYLEPGMNYYPGQDDQPESYRTENPITFGLKAGLRVNFGRNR